MARYRTCQEPEDDMAAAARAGLNAVKLQLRIARQHKDRAGTERLLAEHRRLEQVASSTRPGRVA